MMFELLAVERLDRERDAAPAQPVGAAVERAHDLRLGAGALEPVRHVARPGAAHHGRAGVDARHQGGGARQIVVEPRVIDLGADDAHVLREEIVERADRQRELDLRREVQRGERQLDVVESGIADHAGVPQWRAPAELHAFFTHLRICVPTATSVPSWFLIVMSPVERRRSMSIALMRYSTVTVSPK